jgi:hypothetical protein
MKIRKSTFLTILQISRSSHPWLFKKSWREIFFMGIQISHQENRKMQG